MELEEDFGLLCKYINEMGGAHMCIITPKRFSQYLKEKRGIGVSAPQAYFRLYRLHKFLIENSVEIEGWRYVGERKVGSWGLVFVRENGGDVG